MEKTDAVNWKDFKLNGYYYCTHSGCIGPKSFEKRKEGGKESGYKHASGLIKHIKNKHDNRLGPLLPQQTIASNTKSIQEPSLTNLNIQHAQNEINVDTNSQSTQQQSQNVHVLVQTSEQSTKINEIYDFVNKMYDVVITWEEKSKKKEEENLALKHEVNRVNEEQEADKIRHANEISAKEKRIEYLEKKLKETDMTKDIHETSLNSESKLTKKKDESFLIKRRFLKRNTKSGQKNNSVYYED